MDSNKLRNLLISVLHSVNENVMVDFNLKGYDTWLTRRSSALQKSGGVNGTSDLQHTTESTRRWLCDEVDSRNADDRITCACASKRNDFVHSCFSEEFKLHVWGEWIAIFCHSKRHKTFRV
jgi:hypothetical protein